MKLFCIGRNYVGHIKELHNEMPEDMVVFMKPSTAIFKSQDPWYIPDMKSDIHYECEIVLKICKNGKHIQPAFAHSYFNEISLGIDFTARNLQSALKSKGLPWEKAKAFDNSAVIGNFISKENFNLSGINFQLMRNNKMAQNGNSKNMIYDFQIIICELSKYFTLQTGDLIFTGTPEGVGNITSGDELKGILENQEVFNIKVR